MRKITPDPPNLEDILVRTSELLRCASATAYEAGDQVTGQKRDLALSVVHLLDIAQALLEHGLKAFEKP